MAPRKFRNPAHLGAYKAGHKARMQGSGRSAPYGVDSQESIAFRRAWLAGWDAANSVAPEPAEQALPLMKLKRACRVCGCTDTNACANRCWWVAEDLCSNCGGPPPRRANSFIHIRRAA